MQGMGLSTEWQCGIVKDSHKRFTPHEKIELNTYPKIDTTSDDLSIAEEILNYSEHFLHKRDAFCLVEMSYSVPEKQLFRTQNTKVL
ncbi:hypothetical protein Mal48_25110 [Thalassoglobus polymorphus]|uniref:Uncharacterized protein n=1 Tax=Thalassoglobus polymorphus TaxID=2527994 RepID=A0A517QNP5_9PLAN|nr:hypothetical protein Mal48_25110 [Thalassoglobus polymorphus]